MIIAMLVVLYFLELRGHTEEPPKASEVAYSTRRVRYVVDGKIYGSTQDFDFLKAGNIARFTVQQATVCPDGLCSITAYMRAKTTDKRVARQLFDRLEYEFEMDMEPRYILDAGGNVGYAACIFATRYPDAQVIVIEPDMGNFEMLQRNVRQFRGRVTAVKGALFNTLTTKKLAGTARNNFGYKLLEHATKNAKVLSKVQTYTIPYLMKVFNIPRFDYVKMDIENSELEVFTSVEGYNVEKWLCGTAYLSVEIHSDEASAQVTKILSSNFSKHPHGEYDIWRRIRGSRWC